MQSEPVPAYHLKLWPTSKHLISTSPGESSKAAKTLAAGIHHLKPYYLYKHGDFCIAYIVKHYNSLHSLNFVRPRSNLSTFY